jgi:hypothetical protein
MYASDREPENPVSDAGGNTEYATAALVIGSLFALILISRGFRGVHVGGLSVGVK